MISRKTSVKVTGGGGYEHRAPLPDPPPHLDMQQWISVTAFDAILKAHFAHRDDVLIAGAGYLRGEPDDDGKRFAPDCVVAFGVNPNAIIGRNGYVISEVGWPPDFVLEVASRSTGRRDYTVKRDGYAEYGVREYWRFDHSGGRYHDAPLAGDVLAGETYTPLPIHREPDGLIWGHSEVLSLHLCWDAGILRLRDPATGTFLLTPDELGARMEVAEMRANTAEMRAGTAEMRADTAEARAAALEAELRRLRGE